MSRAGQGGIGVCMVVMLGRDWFAPAAFRVTVATFNIRALRVVRALGFGHAVSFRATTDGRSYEILTRPESTAPPGACGGCHVNAPTESAQLRAPSAGTAPRA